MSRTEAIQALLNGHKITHPSFVNSISDSYIQYKDGKLIDENGYDLTNLWQYRDNWTPTSDWEIHTEPLNTQS